MRPFDYISVLLSFVVSLIFAQILTGISHLIQSGVRRISIPSIYWIGVVLFLSVDFWFSVWSLRDHASWRFAYVCWLLLMVSLLFLVARAAVPEASSTQPIDMTALYDRERRRIMVLFILFTASGIVVNLTLPGFATSELLAIGLALIGLFGIAWRWNSLKVQLGVVVLNFAILVYYAVRYEPLLT